MLVRKERGCDNFVNFGTSSSGCEPRGRGFRRCASCGCAGPRRPSGGAGPRRRSADRSTAAPPRPAGRSSRPRAWRGGSCPHPLSTRFACRRQRQALQGEAAQSCNFPARERRSHSMRSSGWTDASPSHLNNGMLARLRSRSGRGVHATQWLRANRCSPAAARECRPASLDTVSRFSRHGQPSR